MADKPLIGSPDGVRSMPRSMQKTGRRATAGKVATIVSLTIVAVSIFMMLSDGNSYDYPTAALSTVANLYSSMSSASGSYSLEDISERRRADLEALGLSSGAAGSLATHGATAAGLKELAQCSTLDCLTRMHSTLGATKFNFPHFMMVGWQKCATTSIYYHLARHPEVLKPFVKEPHFFTSCQRAGPACKVAGGNNERAYIRDNLQVERAVGSGLTLATMDASVDYAQYAEPMAARLAELFPWVKLVFVMRERIGRAMSWKNMMEQKFGKGCKSELSKCLAGSLRTHNYSHPMTAWLRHFPASQVHVIQLEELAEDPDATMRRLKVFLGLDPDQPPADLRNVNKRAGSSGWPMEKKGYETLLENAREDARQLTALLEKHGLVSATEWMGRWEEVWQRNLATCGADGKCSISSS